MADALSSVCDQLPPAWATLCRSKLSSTFAWAHDGDKVSGAWIELCPDGHLITKWGTGSWECDEEDPIFLKVTFGSSCHVCRLLVDEGKFLVEKRILRRGGQAAPNPKIKGVEVVSAGWPIEPGPHEGKQRSNVSAEKTWQAKLKAAEAIEEKLKAAEEAAVEAVEAAAEAAVKAKEMDRMAKKAEAYRNKVADLAEQARKEAEAAVAERETTGLARFGFVTPQAKRTKDSIEDAGTPPAKKCARNSQAMSSKGDSTKREPSDVRKKPARNSQIKPCESAAGLDETGGMRAWISNVEDAFS